MQVREFTEETPKCRSMSSLTTPRRDRSETSMNIFPGVYHVHGVNGETLVGIKQDALHSYLAF